MKKNQKATSSNVQKANTELKVSVGLRAVIDSVLDKKFNKKVNRNSKDDCDSCGEQCFD